MLIGYILLVITTFLFYRVVRQTLFVDVTIEKNIGFDKWISEQRSRSFEIILKNIHPPGTPRGFLAASLTTFHPNYYYTWTRDAALVIQDISSLPETEDSVLRDYVDFQVYSQNVPTVCDCLGEPKFNPDGTAFSGAWGRPQNDGPAARAITFMSIIDRFTGKYDGYISKTLLPALEKDLDYVTQVWEEPCYDLWEEVDGVHFYTLMAMRKALLDGYKFIDKDEYVYTAKNIQDRLSTFWSPKKNYVRVTQNTQGGVNKSSGLDVSVLLAANKFSDIDDGFFSPASDKILATAAALRASFITVYPINGNLQPDLGTSIGRYPEDVYDGYETTEGNPWFLATAAYAELYYLIIEEWKQHGVTINSVNKEFFKDVVDLEYGDYVPNSNLFEQIISNVSSEADRFLSTIRYYQQTNGSMSEQFNRYTGNMQGARDLTWSHAAFISATDARDIALSN